MPNFLDEGTQHRELDPSNKQDQQFLERQKATADARGESWEVDEVAPAAEVEPGVHVDAETGEEYEGIATIRDFDADYAAKRSDQGRLEVMAEYDIHPSELREGYNMEDLREIAERKLSKLSKQENVTDAATVGSSGKAAPAGDDEASLHAELAQLNTQSPKTREGMVRVGEILRKLDSNYGRPTI